jgi:hypothetical protein
MKTLNVIAEIADVEDTSTEPSSFYPAARLLNKDQAIKFSPLSVSAYLISLYSAFEAHVPEEMKEEFDGKVKELFNNMFLTKGQYCYKTDIDEVKEKSI